MTGVLSLGYGDHGALAARRVSAISCSACCLMMVRAWVGFTVLYKHMTKLLKKNGIVTLLIQYYNDVNVMIHMVLVKCAQYQSLLYVLLFSCFGTKGSSIAFHSAFAALNASSLL